jgi:hypothetical protein
MINLNMTANGLWDTIMVKEFTNGKTVHITRGAINMARSMDGVNMYIQVVISMTGSGLSLRGTGEVNFSIKKGIKSLRVYGMRIGT